MKSSTGGWEDTSQASLENVFVRSREYGLCLPMNLLLTS